MSYLVHAICDYCWCVQRPRRVPQRIASPPRAGCCWCGRADRSGIRERLHVNDTPPWCPDRPAGQR